MNKIFTLLTIIVGIAATYPALADDAVQNDKQAIQSDVNAIHKDNIALDKDKNTLAKDRADKAMDKANNDSTKQAVDSSRIGAVETAIDEKKAEKKVDKETLAHDEKELSEDRTKAEKSSQQ